MSKNEARMRRRLKNLAEVSCHPRSHHAAVIVKNGKIVGESENYGWMHAEQAAINGSDFDEPGDLLGAILYTMMFRARTGSVGDGTPCPECMRAIKAAGIKKVVVYL